MRKLVAFALVACSAAARADGGLSTDLAGVLALAGWSAHGTGSNARFAVRQRRICLALQRGRLLLGVRVGELELKAFAEPGQKSVGAQLGSASSAIARLALPAPARVDLALAASARSGGVRATGIFRTTPPGRPDFSMDAGGAARAFLTERVAVMADAGLRGRPNAVGWVRNASLFGEVQLLGAF